MTTGEGPTNLLSRRQFLSTLGVSTVAVTGFGGYAVAESWSTCVTRYRVAPPRWPAGLSLKLAVIADLHACEPFMGADRIRGIVEATNALQPDCVLLLGDYVASHGMSRYAQPVAHRDWARALGGLTAPLGVHAILGNHDWWDDLEAQRRRSGPTRAGLALQDAGIALYENDSVRLQKDGKSFWLAGLGDQWALTSRTRARDGAKRYVGVDDLGATLGRVSDNAPLILMIHEPDIFNSVPDRVSLTLAGHTHGGQVRVFGYAPIVPSRFGQRYLYGHIVEDGRHLVVSAGLGCSGLPVRLGSPPEIVMIEVAA
ncbi:MAG: metallophosphoesterase [Hyphomicrobium sp.]